MKHLLNKFIANKELDLDESRQLMLQITDGEFEPLQAAALLYAIQVCGVTVDEILGFREALLSTAHRVDLGDLNPIDIVGTGGDGKNTFNISTCAAFVTASAGINVCKHGNYSATSVSGASNVLEAHGAHFTTDESQLRTSIEHSGFVYLHAPLFALGMKNVVPIRKALQVPTLFNMLGPLINPAQPRMSLHGVATLSQFRLYHSVHQSTGDTYGIVNSYDGYDEVSLTGPFRFVTDISEDVYTPEQLGFDIIEPRQLHGGDTVGQAARIFMSVLDGTSTAAQRNVVIINAALAIKVARPELTLQQCISQATQSLADGNALSAFNRYIESTQ